MMNLDILIDVNIIKGYGLFNYGLIGAIIIYLLARIIVKEVGYL